MVRYLCKRYDIKFTYCSVGRPQSNSSLERYHSSLLEMIRIHMLEFPDEHPLNGLQYGVMADND